MIGITSSGVQVKPIGGVCVRTVCACIRPGGRLCYVNICRICNRNQRHEKKDAYNCKSLRFHSVLA